MLNRSGKAVEMLDTSRCEVRPGFNPEHLESVASNEKVSTVQFSVPLSTTEIEALERIVLSQRPDITFRVYGHYQSICDLSFLERTPSVEKLAVDCLLRASQVETITRLRKLKELDVGIFDLESFDFLSAVQPTLSHLALGQTFSKKPSIALISRFTDLKFLYLEGQQKGIDAVSSLESRKDRLTFNFDIGRKLFERSTKALVGRCQTWWNKELRSPYRAAKFNVP